MRCFPRFPKTANRRAALLCALLFAGCQPAMISRAIPSLPERPEGKADAAGAAPDRIRQILDDALRCDSAGAMQAFGSEVVQKIRQHLRSGAILPFDGSGDAGAGNGGAEKLQFRAATEVLGVRVKYFQLSDGLVPGAFVFSDEPYATVKSKSREIFPKLKCESIDGEEICVNQMPVNDSTQGFEALIMMLSVSRNDDAKTSLGCGPYAKDMFR